MFQEITRILTEQGVDEAIACVASQRFAILQTVRARVAAARERNRADLQPLLRAAVLHENKGQPTQARALYADVLSAEPDWPDALHDYLWFLFNQGDDGRVRTTQVDARRDYEEARRLALHLTALDPGNTQWLRDLSVSYNKLSDVAVAQGRLDEAARAYGDALAIRKKLAAGDPGNTRWQRDLSYSLFQISKLDAEQKHWPDAIGNAEASLQTDERLSQLDRFNVDWQEDVKASRVWLEQLRRQAGSTR